MPDLPLEAIYFRDWNGAHIPEILEEIYIKRIYDQYLLGKKNLTIVDIGSNIGLSVYYFKDFAKQVYAIEPSKQHVETLTKMLTTNKIKNVTVGPVAISNKDEIVKLYHNDNSTAFNLNLEQQGKDYEEVEAITFDTFMKRNKLTHIDLLKCDPEGEEGKIFASDEFKKWAPEIDVIVGEWHYWGNCEMPLFANMLRDLGFDFNWIPNMKAQVYTAVRYG